MIRNGQGGRGVSVVFWRDFLGTEISLIQGFGAGDAGGWSKMFGMRKRQILERRWASSLASESWGWGK